MENDAGILTPLAQKNFQEWLRSGDKNDPQKGCYPLLRNVAKAVIRWARDRNGRIRRELRDVLLHDEDSMLAEEKHNCGEADALTSSVVTFVWEFLTNPNRLKDCRVQLVEHFANNNLHGIQTILIGRVINYCKEEARKESNSPFHACYLRMRTAISAAAQKSGAKYQYTVKDGEGSYYAISSRSSLKCLLEGKLSVNEFKGWPHPGYGISEIKRGVVLLGISNVFWGHSLEVIAQLDELEDPEYLLPIKEVVEYIDAMYGLYKPEVQEQVSENEDGDELPSSAESKVDWQQHDPFYASEKQLPSQREVITQDLMVSKLEPEAEKVVAKWKPNKRKSYVLRHYNELKLEKIAPVVGLTVQAVHASIKGAEEAIRQTAMQKGFDREEKLLFLKAVIKIILKYHPECRDEGEGESLSNG